ncbi:MAG: FIST C-terminal domain-containing protein [Myxococcales bacterium]|nr:FIST C-terminal domain-containing protein [Myxococcales bacterium]MBK7198938.1 FIST C-terminal domain-containing protein [Myxococcales bacterium]MBP6844198.1 FIST C-terminal domain-containing protein [Kofleriaceae bacterium]
MRWASAIATAPDTIAACDQAAAEAAEALGDARADLVLAFVTDHHAAGFAHLSRTLARQFPGAAIAGCTVGGAIGGGLEIEHRPALAVTVARLPGVNAAVHHLGPDPDTWLAPDLDARAVIALPCPMTSPVDRLVPWLDTVWPTATTVGGLASGGMTGRGRPGNTLFAGEARHREGAVLVTLDGDVAVDTIVAQGCRPVGPPLFVTKGLGSVILELDGKPALAALAELHASMPPADRALCRHSLFIGLARDGARLGRRDVLVRNLVGCDRASGALTVAASVEPGQVVQFHLRDAATSAEDLAELLAEPAAPAAGALLFSCVGRGQALYGAPNHDSEAFARARGQVPIGGFFCNGELGPVAGKTFVHGYTSAFATFRRRGAVA